MKIKELFEDNETSLFTMTFYFSGRNIKRFNYEKIRDIIKKAFTGYKVVGFNYSMADNQTVINIASSKDFNKIEIEEIVDTLTKALVFDYSASYDFTSQIVLYAMPNSLLEWDDVRLICDHYAANKVTSLHNIDKLIKCKQFVLFSPSYIKECVLGLLKINANIVIVSETKVREVPAWIPIIKKYLAGNKDVWKCQDELQDADLDEYAQL